MLCMFRSRYHRNTNLFCDGDISVGKGVCAEHAGLDVLVFVHLEVLREHHAGTLSVVDLFELRTHLEKVQIGTMTSVEPS